MRKKLVDISGTSRAYSQNIHENSFELFCTGFLYNKKIAISISDNEDISSLGFSNVHLNDATIEVARYLLTQGAKLIYGGDLRKGGYTRQFSELAFQYRDKTNIEESVFINFFSWPIYLKLLETEKAEFRKNRVELRFSNPSTIVPQDLVESFVDSTNGNKLLWATSLSIMRQELARETDGRVFLGGKMSNYLGLYPGIVEEFIYSCQRNTPIYLIGAFGGATKSLVNVLINGSDSKLNSDFQYENKEYKELVDSYNRTGIQPNVSYEKVINYVRTFGVEGLSKYNGLTIEENKRLFSTPFLPEIIYLILKGLSNIYPKP